MESLEYNLRYFEAGLTVLEDYLLSSEVFWTIENRALRGEPAFEQFTLGGLLLARAKLLASPMQGEDPMYFQKLDAEYENLRVHWRVAWGRKCQQSFHNRLGMWRNYLEDYREQAEENADRYTYEVRRRAMLTLLQSEAAVIEPAELTLLHTMDQIVRQILIPGRFIWGMSLAGGFPAEEYWYLYGYLPKRIN
jgi:hypothetical protein